VLANLDEVGLALLVVKVFIECSLLVAAESREELLTLLDGSVEGVAVFFTTLAPADNKGGTDNTSHQSTDNERPNRGGLVTRFTGERVSTVQVTGTPSITSPLIINNVLSIISGRIVISGIICDGVSIVLPSVSSNVLSVVVGEAIDSISILINALDVFVAVSTICTVDIFKASVLSLLTCRVGDLAFGGG
jgi:hypothetical protein